MATGHDEHAHPADGEVHVHVASAKFYIGILAALLILTLLTVSAARVNIDGFFDHESHSNVMNLTVAVLIATMKAGLVATFFMHLRHDKLFNTLAFLSAFLFLAIFLFLTRDDLSLRHQVDENYGASVLPTTGQPAPGQIEYKAAPGESSAEPGKEAPPATSAAPAAPEKH